ncbi:hypothetical protein, partial [Fulvimarina sp. MAC8]|uniref:hypothetical protein n=1 Tax=Fulvimarina sp. MAC8 TaxID=3162874 RepID=UPI0032EAC6E0
IRHRENASASSRLSKPCSKNLAKTSKSASHDHVALHAGIHLDVGKVHNIRVGDQLTIKVGENSMLSMSKEGDILISGKRIKFVADRIDSNE